MSGRVSVCLCSEGLSGREGEWESEWESDMGGRTSVCVGVCACIVQHI